MSKGQKMRGLEVKTMRKGEHVINSNICPEAVLDGKSSLSFSASQLLNFFLLLFTIHCLLFTAAYAAGGDVAWQYRDAQTGIQEAHAAVVDSSGNIIITGYSNTSVSDDYYTVKIKADGTGVLWSNSFDKAGGDDHATGVALDSEDNVIVTGYVWNGSSYDYHTIKYRGSDGAVLWQNTFDAPMSGNDYSPSAAVDSINNVYVAGNSQGTSGADDIVIIKYSAGGPNPDGTPIWQKSYNGPANGHDRIMSITAGLDGIALTGTSQNSTPDFDMITVKYGFDGTYVWEKRKADSGDDSGTAVRIDLSGNVVMTGYTRNGNYKDIYTAKYDSSSGDILWEKTYGGGFDDVPAYMWLDSYGNVFITGYTYTVDGVEDILTAKYDSADGNQEWTAVFNSSNGNSDRAVGIAGDDAGSIFVTGETYNDAAGNYDYQTLKYAAGDGTLLWRKEYNGMANKNDRAVGIGITSGGEPVVGGWSDASTGETFNYDYYAIKYDPGLLNPPTGLAATALSDTEVALSWADNSPNEDGFKIERKIGEMGTYSQIGTVGADVTTYNNTGLMPNTKYYFRVKSFNAAQGDSYYSNEVYVITTVFSYGLPAWIFTYNDPDNGDDYVTAMAVGPDNQPVAAGYSYSAAGQFDYCTLKLDRDDLGLIWNARYDSDQNDQDVAQTAAVDSGNDVLVSGYSYLFGGGAGNTNDIYTIKYPSSGPPEDWADQYNGPAGDDDRSSVIDVSSDGNNNYVMVGYGKNAVWNDDIYVVKYSSAGVRSWVAVYDRGDNDYPAAVAFDQAGNIFVTGYTKAGLYYNYFTGKYNGSTGEPIWTDIYNGEGTGDDFARSLAVDASGNVYVTGLAVTSSGNEDFLTIKYDGATGTRIWTRAKNGLANGVDEAISVRIDTAAGQVVVAGTVLTSADNNDFYMIRYDADGNMLWERTVDRPASNDFVTAASMDHSGNIHVAGYSDSGAGTDILAVWYNAEGAFSGGTTYNGAVNGYDEASSVAVNNLGEAFIGGYATNADGNTDYIVLKVTGYQLQPPSPLRASHLYTSIALTWQDNSLIEDGYYLERKVGACSSANPWVLIYTAPADTTSYTDTFLNPDSDYCYRIKTFRNNGETSVWTQTQTHTLTPPAPEGLYATLVNTTQIDLSWTDTMDVEDGFKIARCGGAGCEDYSVIDKVTADTTTYEDTSACSGTVYRYRVLAYKEGHWDSAFSNMASATTPPPSAPSGISVTASSESKITISWTDNTSDETGFKVERCAGAGCSDFAEIGSAAGNSTSYIDTYLAPSTNYRYRVAAYRTATCGWTSDYSAVQSATTNVVSPTLTGTAASTTRINLSWNDTFSNESGFVLQRCTPAGCDPAAGDSMPMFYNTTSYQDTAVCKSTSYSYRLVSDNKGLSWNGGGCWTKRVPLTITDFIPSAPAKLVITYTADMKADFADIRFYDETAGYELPYWIESKTDGSTATVWFKTGLNNNNIYLYYGNPGASSASSRTQVYYVDDSYPNYPGWSDTRKYTCGSYTMMGGYNNFSVGTTTQKTLTSLPAGDYIVTFNYYHIDSWDSEYGKFYWNDEEKWSRQHQLGGIDVCGSSSYGENGGMSYGTTSVSVTHEGGDAVIKFGSSLNQGPNDESWGVDNITVRMASSTSAVTTGTVQSEDSCFNMSRNTWSVSSNTVNVTTPTPGVPSGLFVAQISESQLDLTWTDNTSDETGFKIERCTGSSCSDFQQISTVGANTTTYSNTGLDIGTDYSYRVRAYKTADCPWDSAYSDRASNTTKTVPAPGNFKATVINSNQIDLTWTDTSSIETGYEVERCTNDLCTDFAKIGWTPANGIYVSDQDVCYGTTYRYRGRSVNAGLSNGTGCWTKRTLLAIDSFQAGSLVKVIMLYDMDMNADFSDLRFYDQTANVELPYWIESRTEGVSATVWIQTGVNNNIYAYYGNPSSASPSYASVFFDNFETDSGAWKNGSINGATISWANGAGYNSPTGLVVDPTGGSGWHIPAAYTGRTFSPPLILNFRYKTGSTNFYDGSRIGLSDATVVNGQPDSGGGNYIAVENSVNGANTSFKFTSSLNGTKTSVAVSGFIITDWNDYSIRWYSDKTHLYVNGILKAEIMSNIPNGNLRLRFITFPQGSDNVQKGYLDNVLALSSSQSYPVSESAVWPAAEETASCFPFSGVWNGPYSGIVNATTPTPVAPSGLSAERITETQIDLAWNDNTMDETSFNIYRCMDDGSPCTVVTPGTPSRTVPGKQKITGDKLYLEMNEAAWTGAAGEVGDSSPSGNHGTAVSGANTTSPGRYGRAGYFAGSQYVDLGNPASLKITGDQTIEMWLYPADFSSRRNPYNKAYGGEGTITIETDGTVNYYYGTNGGNGTPYQGFTMTSALQANIWTHLAIVRDLTNMRLTWYKNGVKVNETAAAYTSAAAGGNSVWIGNGYAGPYKGMLDNIVVYDRVLSSFEVQERYQSIDSRYNNIYTYSDTGLETGKTYRYRVTASRTGVACQWETGPTGEASIATSVPAPGILNAAAVNTTSVNLTWTDTTSTEDGFYIERCQGTACDFSDKDVFSAPASSASFADSTVCMNTDYKYRVQSYNNYDSFSNPGAGCWTRSRPLTINNFQPNLQTRVVVPYDSDMKNNFDDIRFYNPVSHRELPYWIESKTDGSEAAVWIKSDETNNVYLYYGNPNATSSSSAAGFFDFYDSFRGTTIDAFKWAEVDPNNSISQVDDLILNDVSDAWNKALISRASFSRSADKMIYGRLTISADTPGNNHFMAGWETDQMSDPSYTQLVHGLYWNNYMLTTYEKGNHTGPSNQAYSNSTDYEMKVILKSAGAKYYIRGGAYSGWTLVNETSAFSDAIMRVAVTQYSHQARIHFIGIMGNSDIEAVEIGEEQEPAGSCYDISADPWSSPFTNISSVTTPGPVVPVLYAATASEFQIDLSWTDSNNDETGFKVDRCTMPACTDTAEIASLGANLTSFSDAGLLPGTIYRYHVRVYKTTTCGWEVSSDAKDAATNTPAAPSTLSAIARNTTQIDLAWTDSTATETGFTLERCTGGACSDFQPLTTLLPNVTSYSDTAVCHSTTYKYRLKGVNGGLSNNGAGTYCWEWKAPLTITNFQANTQTQITVAYDPAMAPYFSDVRFVDETSGQELPYWMESMKPGVSAVFWFKPANNNNVFMYFGNYAATSASNPAPFFEFYDDFSGPVINTSKWVEIDPDNSISQNNDLILTTVSNSWSRALISQQTFSRDAGKMIYARLKPGANNMMAGWELNQTTNASYQQLVHGLYWNNLNLGSYEKGSNTGSNVSRTYTANTDYEMRVDLKSAGAEYYVKGGAYTDWTLIQETPRATAPVTNYSDSPMRIAVTQNNFQGTIEFIGVRSTPATVPVASAGSKQSMSWGCEASSGCFTGRVLLAINNFQPLYQIQVTVLYVPGMRPDFRDIRFYDASDSVELYSWTESVAYGSSATIWIKTGYSNNIYMYYGDAAAASSSNNAAVFELYNPDAFMLASSFSRQSTSVVGIGAGGTWDSAGVYNPSVIQEPDGTFRMWYAGYDSMTWRIGYATSANGASWTKSGSDPLVMTGSAGSFDDVHADAPSVIREPDGTYKMWYAGYGYNGTIAQSDLKWRIGYATSPDGITWTKYSTTAVLNPGGSAWDSGGVSSPSVIKDSDGTYKMWYSGYDGSSWRIGYATSGDGVNWTKYGTNSVLYTGPAGAWDDVHVYNPSVIKDSDGMYKMWYTAYNSDKGNGTGAQYKIGYAYSLNGTYWIKTSSNPVFTNAGNSGYFDRVHVSGPSVIKDSYGVYNMWYGGYDSVWQIGNANVRPRKSVYSEPSAAVTTEEQSSCYLFNPSWTETPYSNEVASTTPAAVAPGSLLLTAFSNTREDLAWTDNTSDETGFSIERCTGTACGSFAAIGSAGPNARAYPDTTISSATNYCYRVKAYKTAVCGWDVYSASACDLSGMAPPVSLTAEAVPNSRQIALNWTDAESDEDGFEIELKVRNSGWYQIATVGPGVHAYTHRTGIENGVTYTYRVRASRGADQSPYSNEASATASDTGTDTCE